MALISESSLANAAVILDVEEVEGQPRRLRGELVVNGAPYDAIHQEDLEIADLDDPGLVAAQIRSAAEAVRDWIAEERR